MVFQATMLHCKAILGWRQAGLMRWILLWIEPLVQDQSLNLLICSPACYYCPPNTHTLSVNVNWLLSSWNRAGSVFRFWTNRLLIHTLIFSRSPATYYHYLTYWPVAQYATTVLWLPPLPHPPGSKQNSIYIQSVCVLYWLPFQCPSLPL